MKLQDSGDKPTPAVPCPLGKDEQGLPCEGSWKYASIIGMLMYLASNTRPDIAFAVHQCARFTHCPRRSHEQALKRIARYLKATRERGMLIAPTIDLSLDLYADADFAGLWNSESRDDPVSVKSRSGYLVTLGGTPVIWSSKLQTEIALSTQEAEYIALSMGMRELLPLRRLIADLAESFGVSRDEVSKVSAVWEDNQAALQLAQSELPKMTPRTKHIAVKYHWFRGQFKQGEIEFRKIDTTVQKADIYTKGLEIKPFAAKRKLIMGW
jgi:hypothetical protein